MLAIILLTGPGLVGVALGLLVATFTKRRAQLLRLLRFIHFFRDVEWEDVRLPDWDIPTTDVKYGRVLYIVANYVFAAMSKPVETGGEKLQAVIKAVYIGCRGLRGT